MITELSPQDTTVEIGDQVRVDGFIPWVDVVAVSAHGGLTVKHRGLQLAVRAHTVHAVRKDVR